MLLALRSLWEEIYPIDEQFHFVGLLALGRASAPEDVVIPETIQLVGGAVARPRKRRRHANDFDSEPAWKTPVYRVQPAFVNDDDEILAFE